MQWPESNYVNYCRCLITCVPSMQRLITFTNGPEYFENRRFLLFQASSFRIRKRSIILHSNLARALYIYLEIDR